MTYDVNIKGSKFEDGHVTVYFDQPWEYYAHSISSIGKEDDPEGRMNTMWSWINHMRHKIWWSSDLEHDFIKEVSQYFP